MWRRGEFKEVLWRNQLGEVYTAQQLLQNLLRTGSGTVLVDGYSGSGKTVLLRQLQEQTDRPSVRMSSQQVQELLVWNIHRSERFKLNVGDEEVVILEDIDWLRGKEQILEEVGHAITRVVEYGGVVILTGYKLHERVPGLVRFCDRTDCCAYYEAVGLENG